MIEDAQQIAEQGSVTYVLKHILQHSGYQDELKAERTEESIARLENLQELINVTSQYDQVSEGAGSLSEFLENVALISDIDTLNESGDAVTLMTLHSSKGLEFPVVYLAGMEEGVFPHSRSLNDHSELEEERRLAYVGMTRAREELRLTHARRRSVYGQPSFNLRSRFIDDIPVELLDEQYAVGSQYAATTPSRSVYPERTGGYTVVNKPPTQAVVPGPAWKAPFQIGDRVSHPKFGVGVVISCSPVKNDAEVTVVFPGVVGQKKLIQGFAKLEKVSS
jgi:DNA helicase II / ATP-dependent DNA helicase PcrA